MVEFDCGECKIALEAVDFPSVRSFSGDQACGPYPAHLLACPRCGASWEQATTGVLIKL